MRVLVLAAVALAGCGASSERYEGSAVDCSAGDDADVLLILERKLGEPVQAMIGLAPKPAVGSWEVVLADDVQENGAELNIAGVYQNPPLETTLSAALLKIDDTYTGDLAIGDENECSVSVEFRF